MATKKGPTVPRPWGQWSEATSVRVAATGEEKPIPEGERVVVNNLYTVILTALRSDIDDDDGAEMIWLSIRRNDRKPARDWRHLQRIKNELVGAECEAVELFPAESRLVDEANQTHLWCIADDSYRWPFGYQQRSVLEADDPRHAEAGSKQRPFDKETNE